MLIGDNPPEIRIRLIGTKVDVYVDKFSPIDALAVLVGVIGNIINDMRRQSTLLINTTKEDKNEAGN